MRQNKEQLHKLIMIIKELKKKLINQDKDNKKLLNKLNLKEDKEFLWLITKKHKTKRKLLMLLQLNKQLSMQELQLKIFWGKKKMRMTKQEDKQQDQKENV